MKITVQNAGQPKSSRSFHNPLMAISFCACVQRYDSFNILTNVVWQWTIGRLVLLEWCYMLFF